MTAEGVEVAERGSHEAVVWGQVGEAGCTKEELMGRAGPASKVGFSKAIAAGWILLDKVYLSHRFALIVNKIVNSTG